MNGDFLTELFASRLRAAVLSYIAPRSHRGYSLTELSHALNMPISSLQHECYKLERIGILDSAREGASRRYTINPAFEARRELTALVVRAVGQQQALQATLEDMAGLRTAFIAAELPLPETVIQDSSMTIPLVLVGDIPLEEIDAVQERIAVLLGLPQGRVEAVYYLEEDWQARVDQRAPYAVWLLEGPRTHLAGAPV